MGLTRTNIEIDDEAVAEVMRRYGFRTKKDAVNFALRRLVLPPMTREEALEMQGANLIGEIPPESPIEELDGTRGADAG